MRKNMIFLSLLIVYFMMLTVFTGCVQKQNVSVSPSSTATPTSTLVATPTAKPTETPTSSPEVKPTAIPTAKPQTNQYIYQNTQYGFSFNLPKSWKGYKIVTDKWIGYDVKSGKISETGPMISIRHPLWTAKKPRQDIPIMVFTLSQWNSLQQEKFHIGAAPIGPSELGRNSRYVFALPARYNYAFLTGYKEVENILIGKPLQPNENINSKN